METNQNQENQMISNKVLDLYFKVFDQNDQVKVCGREACKKLIVALTEDAADRGLSGRYDFGSPDTGIMNLITIQYYVSEFFG